ncbi:hypothetical protein Bca52824_017236 [Brassica carinata]|uniref:F-box/LRR-repeat protein 15/At3g58940/PEG3-like LRR domain-containing protein n=1 Tax=Brassica carinata TaxID=52824 RepID=A0A8X7VM84_BRACI|nr:hypothetical protein Bca52824_017236 [Brassica carinata]
MVYNSFELPERLFSYLETLILEKLSLVDISSNYHDLSCLKHLNLLSVRFSSDESVKTLLRVCPRLEELVVRRSSYTNVKIFAINVPTPRSLSIVNSSGKSRPKGVHGFVINAPSLRSFSIRDSFFLCKQTFIKLGYMAQMACFTVSSAQTFADRGMKLKAITLNAVDRW